MPTLADVVDLLHSWYPPGTADSWDAVGLVAGDPQDEFARVMFAVDPTIEVAREAVEWGAGLLVVHHPLLLTPVSSVAATTPKGRTLAALTRVDCGLLTAHTNADHGSPGVSDALARELGLTDVTPVKSQTEPLDKLVVFAPVGDAEAVRAALHRAGAGHVGDYDTVSYTVAGEGRFRPMPGAHPVVGEDLEQQAVFDATVDDVHRLHAIARRIQRRTDLGQHAAR